MNKLEEQARSGYSYFASGQANGDAAPKKLTEQEAEELAAAQRQATNSGASVWNSAGTFEERPMGDWAKQRLKELLPGTSHCGVTVNCVTSITGEAHIWFVRGKKRAGFDLHIQLSWVCPSAGDAEAIKGTVSLPSASPDDLDDLHMECTLTSGATTDGASAALAASKALKGALAAKLCEFYEELKLK